jgi:hypothetical protein
MKPFDARNWYWIVVGDETRVYSSSSGDYVPISNPAYVAWLADGTLPTRIANEVELGEVLAPHRVRPIAAGVLDGYLEKQAGDVVDMVQFKLLFNHENRLRAIERALSLNGSPANLTAAQARAAVKVLL